MRGLFGANRDCISTHHTWVEHMVPRCKSDEIYKGIVSDEAKGSFRGRVTVRPDAQETEARQSNANLILDDRAEIDTKPQLEINADNVRCAHGSTIGRLDESALFFLRSRGLEETAAKRLLLKGFAASALELLPIAELRDTLIERTISQFGSAA
jgi:Fe-S cluster assembly protein SufD